MGKVLIPIKEGEKSCREPGQGYLGWAEVGSSSRQGWECSSNLWERFPGTFSKPWANRGLRQSFPGSLPDRKPSFSSWGFSRSLRECCSRCFCCTPQGNTWGAGAARTMAEVQMGLGRDLEGILQKFRWKIAEEQMESCRGSEGPWQRFRWNFPGVQMENCRGSGGILQRFMWTIAEIQMEFYTDLDGQLQRFKEMHAGLQMDF